ncbi:hypothetical protein Srubr_03770 [Streptomyces rubradiris]|uniref:Uncharacterized protein n=1 Tax=Streptomyces rubradiris TaxID=285531 RepID=A0ABQ3R3T7_STRRR|nr:hypothetical protein GCM10018792_22830 [Streptomyces rubradiris]GHI50531.1 hypothetical protein Srubr_03770 [Streptomyces rubradiris]
MNPRPSSGPPSIRTYATPATALRAPEPGGPPHTGPGTGLPGGRPVPAGRRSPPGAVDGAPGRLGLPCEVSRGREEAGRDLCDVLSG